MKPTPAFQAIIVPLFINLSYAHAKTFQSGTAISVVMQASEQQPTATFDAGDQLIPVYSGALDWLALSKAILPNAEPLAPDERASINEFFWSHFE
jgi:hypothetical protein